MPLNRDAIDAGFSFEGEFVDRVGGKRMPGSGNQWFASCDIENVGQVIWSLKHTKNRSFELTSSDMQEVIDAAYGPGGRGNVIPMMAVGMGSRTVVIFPEAEDFFRLVEEKAKFVRQSKAEAKREAAQVPILLREE